MDESQIICLIDLLLRNIRKMWINNLFQNFLQDFRKLIKLIKNFQKTGK
jgi:hypothetical protein